MADLTLEQMDAIRARLAAQCAAARATIEANTGGFWHSIVSGDNGGGERSFVAVVEQNTLPMLERTEQASVDSGSTDRWLATARDAEKSLAQVRDLSSVGTIDQMLADTATQTAKDTAKVATQIASTVALAIPWWLYAAGVVALVAVVAVKRRNG